MPGKRIRGLQIQVGLVRVEEETGREMAERITVGGHGAGGRGKGLRVWDSPPGLPLGVSWCLLRQERRRKGTILMGR